MNQMYIVGIDCSPKSKLSTIEQSPCFHQPKEVLFHIGSTSVSVTET